MTNQDRIRKLLESRLSFIAQAATRGDVSEITRLTKDAAELEALLKADLEITEGIARWEQTCTNLESVVLEMPSRDSESQSHLRVLPIEVSEGMINQNLLTFTRHVKQRRIKVGEHLFIESLPSGERFRTILLRNGNKLQERGAISRFYEAASVHPGDFVEMIEISPQQWTLRKAESGKYFGKQGWTTEEIQKLLS